MKKITKIAGSFILTLIISLSFLTTAVAYEYGEINIESMIITEKVGEKINYYISGNDINRIKVSKSRSMRSKNNYEKLYEIFTFMDSDMSEKYKEIICSNLDLDTIEGIRISEEFLEIDENGNKKTVDREYALSESQKAKKTEQSKANSSTEWHESDPETYKSGLITYMQQQLIAVYTPHYNGNKTTPDRYVFLGISQWLSNPINRKKDCVTLSSNVFTWANKSSSDYLGCLLYDVDVYVDNQIFDRYQESKELNESDLTVLTTTGAYFVLDLPRDSAKFSNNRVIYSNFGFMFMGVAKTTTKPELLNIIGVNLIYSHTKTSLSPSLSFGWSSDSGISFGVAVSGVPTTTEYKHSFSWSIKDDYDKYIR